MTQPAEITSRSDWELLRLNLREVGDQIDALYWRITDPGDDNADDRKEKEKPVSDPNRDPDLAADEEAERQRRLDYENDAALNDDTDAEPGDEPEADQQ